MEFERGRQLSTPPALRLQIPVLPLAVVPPEIVSLDKLPTSLAANSGPYVPPIKVSPTLDRSATPPPSSALLPPSPTGILPPELVDVIISLAALRHWRDELKWNENVPIILLNCALVCRSWVAIARRQTPCFLRVTICTNERWITFSRVLSSERCTFRMYTETLSISACEPPVPDSDALSFRERSFFHLPHLRTLTLNGRLSVDMRWMSRALKLFGGDLVQLNVAHAFFADDFEKGFSACRKLETCNLRDIRGGGDLRRCLGAPPLKLKTLALTNVSELVGQGFLHWLARFSDVSELEDVLFCTPSEADCVEISDFFKALRRTIVSLTLRFSDIDVFDFPLTAQVAFCRQVDLGVLCNLKRLELYLPIAGVLFTQRDITADQVPALLTQITSAHFVELSLFVHMDQMDNLKLVDWSSVIRILDRRNFAGMQRIVVHGMSMMPEEEVTRLRGWLSKSVAARLPANTALMFLRRRMNVEREERFKRNEDALAQLQSLLDMLPTVEACEVVQAEEESVNPAIFADEDFIHPVIFAGAVFLIMVISSNFYELPTYVQQPFKFFFLGYYK